MKSPQGREAKRVWDRENSYKRRLRAIERAKALPDWADRKAISKFYRNCPPGHHVDHIVPLRNEAICGLHILENLQYLPEEENKKKGNTFDESTAVGYFCPVRVER